MHAHELWLESMHSSGFVEPAAGAAVGAPVMVCSRNRKLRVKLVKLTWRLRFCPHLTVGNSCVPMPAQRQYQCPSLLPAWLGLTMQKSEPKGCARHAQQ